VRGVGADVGEGAEVEGVEGRVFFWSRKLLMVVAEPLSVREAIVIGRRGASVQWRERTDNLRRRCLLLWKVPAPGSSQVFKLETRSLSSISIVVASSG
jgi:hypothetical protein